MKRAGIGWRVRGLVMSRSYNFPHDCFVCCLCSDLISEGEVVIDHILPVVLGGTNKPDNLQVACRSCNQVKRDRHPRDDFHHLIFAAKGDPEYADKPVLRLVKS